MESYDFVDTSQAENANPLARYRTFTSITKLFQFIEVFVAVAVISWSTTRLPLALKFSGEYISAFPSYFMNQHVVFLVGNLIIVVCYVLSRYSDSGNESGDSGFHYDDGHYRRFAHRKITSDVATAKPIQSEPVEVQNSMIRYEKSVIKTVKTEPGVAGETEVKPETKQMERFQRSRSEKLKRQIPMKPERELRRSMTEMRWSAAVASSGRESIEALEKLSNEEFRIAMDTFIISRRRRFLKQQSMVEDES